MKVHLFFRCVLLMLYALALFSCSSNELKVKQKNFDTEISQQQNLIFTFNQDIARPDELERWDTLPYIKFEPAVRGKFKWLTSNQLLFSPEVGFEASTSYEASLQETLLREEKLRLSSKKIIFSTPAIELQSSHSFWAKGPGGQPELQSLLYFNYQINPEDLKKRLSVSVEGKTYNPRVISANADKEILIGVADAALAKYQESSIQVEIEAGLLSTESATPSKAKISHQSRIPDRNKLEINEVKAIFNSNMEAGLRVLCSQAPDENALRTSLELVPQSNYQIESVAGGFLLKGNFNPLQSYSFRLAKGLRGVLGGRLAEEYSTQVSFGELAPQIAFSDKKATYLSSKGSKNVGVKIVNVGKIKVSIYKIYENNMLSFLRYYAYAFNSDYDYYGVDNYEDFGSLVLEREYEVRRLPEKDGIHLLNLDLDKLSELKGIYAVQISSEEQQYISAKKLIAISDIGLIAKVSPEEVSIFANSIQTTEALGEVKINLISSNNQVLESLQTDAKGLAQAKDLLKKYPDFQLKMITASLGSDFTYLHFDQNLIETSQYETGGLRSNAANYQAFIQLERDLYRPDEEIHFAVVLRDEAWKAPPAMPIKIKILLPDGKEFTSLRATLNKEGAFESTLKLPANALTGTYTLEVYSHNDLLLNSAPVSVEEFMPDRIKLQVKSDAATYRAGQSVRLRGEALNLYGPPAANRNYQLQSTLKRKSFAPKEYQNFNFHIVGKENAYFNTVYREGQTDEQGLLAEDFIIPAYYRNYGLLEGNAYITVFDESGRPVSRSVNFEVETQAVFYGIQEISPYASTDQNINLQLLALDKAGKLRNASALVSVVQIQWQNVLERDYYGNMRYVSQRKEVVLEEKNIQINGQTSYTFRPSRGGEYELRLADPQSPEAYVRQYFYAYGWGAVNNSSFEIDKDGKILIELDKASYKVGEKAKVLLKTPFAGKILISIERNKVLEHFYINSDQKSAVFELPIKEAHLPNIYIAATLLKPLSDGAVPLTVAHGYAHVQVHQERHQLPLRIEAAASTGSNTEQIIKVSSKPESDIEVIVAVVDEGILQIKNTASPDPYVFFFQKRALEVNTYDLYPKLFPELRLSSSVGGGDFDDVERTGLSNSTNPMSNKRVKLVSFWSGILKTNAKGEATYKIQVPQYSGNLRVMAVAYKGTAFGAATHQMRVADPLVVSTGLPRFLSPNDEVLVPVSVANTTAADAQSEVSLEVGKEIQVIGAASQSLSVPANTEKRVFFKIKAQNAIGTTQIQAKVMWKQQTFKELTELTIRPLSPPLVQSQMGTVEAGKSKEIVLKGDFLPNTGSAKVLFSKSPAVQLSEQLDYLIQYPYGCAEQTISSAFPQLYVMDLSNSLQGTYARGGEAKYNVQEAIMKLQSMQLYNGAITYWQGESSESWWATAYGLHFLWEARKAGFQVNLQGLDRMADYLSKQVKLNSTQRYTYRDDTGREYTKTIASKEIAYSLYVLALMRRADLPIMNFYKANASLLSLDAKYLLASTYLILGDAESFRRLLPPKFAGERADRALEGSFYSYIRDEALALNALLEADPRNVQIPTMAKHLSEQVRQSKYLNTQEAAFSLLALGKIARESQKAEVKATVQAGGKTLATFDQADLALSKEIAGKTLQVNNTGKGTLYYFTEQRGIGKGKVREEDKSLRVRKAFYNRLGQRITDATFTQNDLIVVKISIESTNGASLENIAITDMLPAGFEIENPRLVDNGQLAWAEAGAKPDYLDIRDDRINIFCTADGKTKHFYYMVRAVSQGNFQMGVVGAEAMYNADYHSYHGAGTVRVLAKGAAASKEVL
jgi:uncharacterized protein YfaS (alpha-2-macroglobulin family)